MKVSRQFHDLPFKSRVENLGINSIYGPEGPQNLFGPLAEENFFFFSLTFFHAVHNNTDMLKEISCFGFWETECIQFPHLL